MHTASEFLAEYTGWAEHVAAEQDGPRLVRLLLANDLIGVSRLSATQLRAALAASQASACGVPADCIVPSRLHELRVRLQTALDAHRADLARLQALFDAAPQAPAQAVPAPAQDDRPATDDERALLLLRAGLSLVLGQQRPSEPEGGQRARLTPPRPTRPSGGGVALAPPADDIPF